jgi:transcriptional regulator with PAS, ATPase and Fis domain
VDCGALPESLLESELFGHVRGAFTGASNPRQGAFQRAHGGTIFLDELGAVSPTVQARLLRVIEAREVRPVGSDAPRAVDVRVIAASRHDLSAAVAAGSFRPDLFYRLSVLRVALPPLRARAKTSRRWWQSSCGSAASTPPTCTAPRWTCSTDTTGPATCASCAT